MSPIRRDGERAAYHPTWQSWLDEAIAAARERGEFDDLPGKGQPLRIAENPFAGEWEMAFHVLENAGMAPPWMEMSREIREGMAGLAELRERAARHVQASLALIPAKGEAPPADYPRPRFWWWPFRRARSQPPANDRRPGALAALEAERRWARRDYLERAARLDEVIAAYNVWLPENLRRLQKPRLPASWAAREFDAACPPISHDSEDTGCQESSRRV